MKRLTHIDLCPVIDFTPFYYDIEQRFPLDQTTDQRYVFWKALMKTIGFDDLIPIQKGLELVPTDLLSDKSLRKIFKFHGLMDPCGPKEETTAAEDRVYSSFNGGVAMAGDGEVLFIPQCCTSFADYTEWLEVETPAYFQPVYMGHPWIYVHVAGDDLIFSGYIQQTLSEKTWEYKIQESLPHGYQWGGNLTDLDQEGKRKLMNMFVVKLDLFRAAQAKLKRETDLFYDRVVTTLQNMVIDHPIDRSKGYVKGIYGIPSYDKEAGLPALPFGVEDL